MENKKKSYEENTKVLSEALFVLHSLTMRVFSNNRLAGFLP